MRIDCVDGFGDRGAGCCDDCCVSYLPWSCPKVVSLPMRARTRASAGAAAHTHTHTHTASDAREHRIATFLLDASARVRSGTTPHMAWHTCAHTLPTPSLSATLIRCFLPLSILKADGARRVEGPSAVWVFNHGLCHPTDVWVHDFERGRRVHLRRAERNCPYVFLRSHRVDLCSSALSIHHEGLHKASE